MKNGGPEFPDFHVYELRITSLKNPPPSFVLSNKRFVSLSVSGSVRSLCLRMTPTEVFVGNLRKKSVLRPESWKRCGHTAALDATLLCSTKNLSFVTLRMSESPRDPLGCERHEPRTPTTTWAPHVDSAPYYFHGNFDTAFFPITYPALKVSMSA